MADTARPRWSTAVRAAGTLLALGLVAACAEQPQAEPLPPIASSPTDSADAATAAPDENEPDVAELPPTTSEWAPGPTLPASASEESLDGARAFGRYFFDLLNYANESGDVAALRRLSTNECQSCRNTIEAIEDKFGQGRRTEGAIYSVLSSEPLDATPSATPSVIVGVSRSAGVTRDGSGSEVGRTEVLEDLRLRLDLRRQDDTWVVTGISDVS